MGQRRLNTDQRIQSYRNYTIAELEGYTLNEALSPSGVTFDDANTGNDVDFSDGVTMDEDIEANFLNDVVSQIMRLSLNLPLEDPDRFGFLQLYVNDYQIADVENNGSVGANDALIVSKYVSNVPITEAERDWIQNNIVPYTGHDGVVEPKINISRFDQNKWYTPYDTPNNFDSIGRSLVGTDSIGYHGITQWW